MRLAALFSGGKDSTIAVYDSLQKGHQVNWLITMKPKNPESYMFHYPNIDFTSHQAKSMGIPQILQRTKGEKEKELADLELAVSKSVSESDGLIAGGLASNYQRNRIKAIADKFGLEFFSPYWNIDPEEYWNILLDLGFQVMICGVACEGLGKEWLGRIIDRQSYKELLKLSDRHKFHLAFEGGEAETFILDCPLFSKRLEVTDGEVVWNRDSGFYIIKGMKLVDKE